MGGGAINEGGQLMSGGCFDGRLCITSTVDNIHVHVEGRGAINEGGGINEWGVL